VCLVRACSSPTLFVFAPALAPIPARAAGASLPPLCPFSSFSWGENQCLLTHTYRIFALIFLSFSSAAEHRPSKLDTLLGPCFPTLPISSYLFALTCFASRPGFSCHRRPRPPLQACSCAVSSRPRGSEGLCAMCTRTPSCTPRERGCVPDAADGVALVGAESARLFQVGVPRLSRFNMYNAGQRPPTDLAILRCPANLLQGSSGRLRRIQRTMRKKTVGICTPGAHPQ
jgi:hypothetical protein